MSSIGLLRFKVAATSLNALFVESLAVELILLSQSYFVNDISKLLQTQNIFVLNFVFQSFLTSGVKLRKCPSVMILQVS